MPGPAGGAGKPPCIVEKNAVYYDSRIVYLMTRQAMRYAEDCCSSCNAYNRDHAPAAPPSDAAPLHCNLWTW